MKAISEWINQQIENKLDKKYTKILQRRCTEESKRRPYENLYIVFDEIPNKYLYKFHAKRFKHKHIMETEFVICSDDVERAEIIEQGVPCEKVITLKNYLQGVDMFGNNFLQGYKVLQIMPSLRGEVVKMSTSKARFLRHWWWIN